MKNQLQNFNLRVYGLLIHEGKVLVTDENRGGMMTKFPGGGLEKGEGLVDCVIREFMEEIEINISVNDFFYVNDFLQVSAFRSSDQLLSFYYKVETLELDKIPIVDQKIDLELNQQSFRWLEIETINENEFTFPIDRVVVAMLKKLS